MAVFTRKHLGHALLTAWLAIGTWAPDATAQQPQERQPTAQELSTARQLFADGVRAERAGKWQDALALFRRVATIAPTPVVHYHVGLCAEHTGHLVEATNAYQLSLRDARRKNDKMVMAKAQQGIDKLEGKVPTLVVKLPADAEGISIAIDGKPVHRSLVGTPILVDPGSRQVVVKAANYSRAAEQTVEMAEGATETLELSLGEKLAPQVEEPAPPAQKPKPTAPAVPDDSADEINWLPILIGAGATAVFAGVSVATGVVAHGKIQDYEEANAQPTPGSLAAREEMRDDAVTMAWISTGFTAGAVVAAGVTGVFGVIELMPADQGDASASLGLGAGSVTIHGHF
jgi:hypothetical protein